MPVEHVRCFQVGGKRLSFLWNETLEEDNAMYEKTWKVKSSSSSPQSTKAWPSHTMGQQGDRPRIEAEVIWKKIRLLKFITIYHRNSKEMRNTSPRSNLGQGDPAVEDSLPLLLLPFHLLQDSLPPVIPSFHLFSLLQFSPPSWFISFELILSTASYA